MVGRRPSKNKTFPPRLAQKQGLDRRFCRFFYTFLIPRVKKTVLFARRTAPPTPLINAAVLPLLTHPILLSHAFRTPQNERGRDIAGGAGAGPGGPNQGAAPGVAARGRAAAVAGPGRVPLGRPVDAAAKDASRRWLRHLPRQVNPVAVVEDSG